jgi:hypothetical protein
MTVIFHPNLICKYPLVWPPPDYWKPPPDHNPGPDWDHPEGGKGNGKITDGATDKKEKPITWITDPTAKNHYKQYNDMYIAQQVRVHEFRKANAHKRKEAEKKKKKATRNTSAVSSELILRRSSADSSVVFPRNHPVPATDPSVPKGFYGLDDDNDRSESSDSIFDRSTDDDLQRKPAAVDISGMVVDEVRNIGATFTQSIVTPIVIGVPELPGRNASYADQFTFYLRNRKANPSLQPPPQPPPTSPPVLSVRIVKLNLMPVVPGLPESGLIADCTSWPEDAENGRHIQHIPLDRSISIHKRSERQLRHVVFHYRRLYHDTINHLNYLRPNGYWTSWETRVT